MSKPQTLKLKRGDDFKLDLTVQDLNKSTAVTALAALTTAKAAYQTALAADPASQATTDALAAQVAAQAAYNTAIKVDISAWTISSAMGWCGKTVLTLAVTITSGTDGVMTVIATAAQTALLVPRTYQADIQFTRPEGTVSSDTFLIEVMKDITGV